MRLLWAFVLLSFSSSLFAADVDAILRERISVRKAATAIAAAIVTPEGTRFFHSGAADENTLFRVASATKVFTSVLLADMIARGEVALDEPVAKYLPPGTILPASRRPITLRDLATHRAGLPNMPSNFREDGEYREKELYAFLAKCRLESEPGDAFHYSNAGMAILGLALTRRANLSFEDLLARRITASLEMTASHIRVDPGDPRLAPGHDRRLRAARFHRSNETLAGASELVSSVRDLSKFVAAALAIRESPLDAAFASSMEPLATRDEYHAGIGLGWWIDEHRGRTFVWHGGESRDGYKSFIGLDRERKIGVVILSDSRNGIEDIGVHLLDERMALDPFGKITPRPPSSLDYAGRYQVRPSYTITIEQKGKELYGHAHGRPRRLIEIAKDSFRIEGDVLQIDFLRAESGEVTSLLLHGEGQVGEGARTR